MMELPTRKALRLPGYDYSQSGAYFLTICTEGRRCLLSSIRRGDPCGRPQVALTDCGRAAQEAFQRVEALCGVQFDCFVVMPNHLHFICRIDRERATARVAPTLGRIVDAYKSIVFNACKDLTKGKLWQRGYYEHVIRNEADYREIWRYIDENPARWAVDRYYTP